MERYRPVVWATQVRLPYMRQKEASDATALALHVAELTAYALDIMQHVHGPGTCKMQQPLFVASAPNVATPSRKNWMHIQKH